MLWRPSVKLKKPSRIGWPRRSASDKLRSKRESDRKSLLVPNKRLLLMPPQPRPKLIKRRLRRLLRLNKFTMKALALSPRLSRTIVNSIDYIISLLCHNILICNLYFYQ